MAGQVVDNRYQIGERLGAGGVGTVYRAVRLGVERVFAIKFLQPTRAVQSEFRKRFAREALAMSRLYHVHVVGLNDYGVHEGMPYLVMEYVPGKTLTQRLREGPLEPQRAVRIMHQILVTLEYFHENDVVHRDLKSGNIMLIDSDGQTDFVKLLDFGMAKLLDGLGSGIVVSVKGTIVGTPSTMSPEQIKDQEIDPRSDVYSAGILLYEMIAGHKPFRHPDPFTVMKMHLKEAPAPLRTSIEEPLVSEKLEQVIMKALAKDRDQRFPSAEDMASALLDTPEGGEIDEADTIVTHTGPTSKQWRRVVFLAASGWAIAALLLVAVLVAIGIGGGSDEPDRNGENATASAVDGAARPSAETTARTADPGLSDRDRIIRRPRHADNIETGDATAGGQAAPNRSPETSSQTPPGAPSDTSPEPSPATASDPGSATASDALPAVASSGSSARTSSSPPARAGSQTKRDAPPPNADTDRTIVAGPATGPTATVRPARDEVPGPRSTWQSRRDRAVELVAAGEYRAAFREITEAVRMDRGARSDPALIGAAIGTLALPNGDQFIPFLVREFGKEPAAVAALIKAVPGGQNWYVRHHAWIALSRLGKFSKADRVGMWLADLRQARSCRMVRRSYARLSRSDDPRSRRAIEELSARTPENDPKNQLRCLRSLSRPKPPPATRKTN
ncbi:MAG: protein kinase [Proteobacteria bacterium]|nr:protein kinase [Pseudomonadota bacterium]